MRKLIILGLILLTGCVQKRNGETQNTLASKIVGVTDNEYKGVGEAINFYGGVCNRHIGFETKNGEKQTYFELEFMQSELLEKYAKIIEMPSSNIAYLFYRNLGDSEKSKYSFIRVTIDFKDGGKEQNDYLLSQLKVVTSKLGLFKTTSELMSKSDYNRLFGLFDKQAAPDLTIEQLKDICTQMDSKYGMIDSVQFQGFSFFKTNDSSDKEYLHLAGIQIRKNQNTPLSIFIDPNISTIENSINTLKFEF